MFERFVLHSAELTPERPWGTREPECTDVHLGDDCERWVEPEPHGHAIEAFDEDFRPVLARKPLDQAAKTPDDGSSSR